MSLEPNDCRASLVSRLWIGALLSDMFELSCGVMPAAEKEDECQGWLPNRFVFVLPGLATYPESLGLYPESPAQPGPTVVRMRRPGLGKCWNRSLNLGDGLGGLEPNDIVGVPGIHDVQLGSG